MAWTTGKLSDTRLRSLKPTQKLKKYSDGKGLQFWVTPEGGRYWRLEYRFGGKRKLLALGTYPEITAEVARQRTAEARRNIQLGHDPSVVKQQAKAASRSAAENTFAHIADKLLVKKREDGRAEVTLRKIEWILGKVNKVIGNLAIGSIRTPDISKLLAAQEEADNLETARRMRIVIGEVFRHAIRHGLCEHDPTIATRGAIAAPKSRHFPAILNPVEFGEMLRHVDAYATKNVVTGAALQLMALLYPRPGELRQADWREFDLENCIWQIPAERMKLRQPHVKALPRQAVAILRTIHEVTGPVGSVFPAIGKRGRVMSENTLNQALRRIGYPGTIHTSHGFRASASTLLNASNMFSADAIERSLAHQDKDAVRRAYARGDAMAERKLMAQWWADYIDRLKSEAANERVVQLRRTS